MEANELFKDIQVFTGEMPGLPAPQELPGVLAEVAAQREIASIQGAMAIAKRFPRNQKKALDRILIACQRPSLAEKSLYSYARGGTEITGPSIRLAEAIAQQWGNLDFGIRELEQRFGESTVEAYAWDLETNTRRAVTFQVRHIRHTKKGTKNLEDPRDIYEMVANLGARRLRASILAVIPGDVVDAAVEQCEQTLKAKADASPEAIQKMLTVFGEYGVNKTMIEARIQRKLESITAAQIISLRKIFNSLRDGMSKPEDWFDLIEEELEEKKKPGRPPKISVKPPESPPGDTKAEGKGEGQGRGEKTPEGTRGITEATIEAIKEAIIATGLALDIPYSRIGLSLNILVEELTEADGQAILEYYRSQ